ncbi:hypothetical protein D623_10024619 [Myotis brandtii]|uniref:Uncharacterized protein n=1 Tax=Myotis brandtii TaxID=109478 RepID=S7PZS8_MYOBR|nr:hypothetical protein D623_10024619 [Myotis brandtii]
MPTVLAERSGSVILVALASSRDDCSSHLISRRHPVGLGLPCRSVGWAVPVACKSCPCGYIFISRKLLNAKHPEKSPPSTENKHEAKRRRTERARREKMHPTGHKDLENRKRSRSNSHSDHSRRGRGRPKSASAKKHEEEREKQEKEIDIYANLSDEKAFVFSVALAEINRKIINQRLIL